MRLQVPRVLVRWRRPASLRAWRSRPRRKEMESTNLIRRGGTRSWRSRRSGACAVPQRNGAWGSTWRRPEEHAWRGKAGWQMRQVNPRVVCCLNRQDVLVLHDGERRGTKLETGSQLL